MPPQPSTSRGVTNRVAADPEVTVVAYGRLRHDLEDVFVDLVEQQPNR